MTLSQKDVVWLRNHIFHVKLTKILALRLGLTPEEFDDLFKQAEFAMEAEYLDLRARYGDL